MNCRRYLKACDTYFEKTGRRMTYEYSLVHGVNDTDQDAQELFGTFTWTGTAI